MAMILPPAFELEQGEVVIREARKHWLLFVFELTPYAILTIIPFALSPFLRLLTPLAPYADIINYGEPLARGAIGIWLLIVWTSAWGTFTRYYLNLWILTDRRIVEIIQHTYFHREVSSVLLNRVQDVTTEVRGALFSLLNIGNIHVQSAGTIDEFHMNGIGGPEALRDIILAHTSRESRSSEL